MKNDYMIIGSIALAVVTGGVGFWGGNVYAKSRVGFNFQNRTGGRQMTQSQNMGRTTMTNMTPDNSQGFMGRGATVGEVSAKDDNSITIKMSNGSSRIIILSGNTTYRIASETGLDKVEVGTKVAAFGETGNDGNITATSIEINPLVIGQTQ
jgi:hypothetical protein